MLIIERSSTKTLMFCVCINAFLLPWPQPHFYHTRPQQEHYPVLTLHTPILCIPDTGDTGDNGAQCIHQHLDMGPTWGLRTLSSQCIVSSSAYSEPLLKLQEEVQSWNWQSDWTWLVTIYHSSQCTAEETGTQVISQRRRQQLLRSPLTPSHWDRADISQTAAPGIMSLMPCRPCRYCLASSLNNQTRGNYVELGLWSPSGALPFTNDFVLF